MNETQTNAPEAQEVAPAAAPAQDVQQPALVRKCSSRLSLLRSLQQR